MTAQMLNFAGLNPTALVGAGVPSWKSNTLVNDGNLVVVEACEAFGSFLEMHPTHTIITNIEADHLDYYKTFDNLVDAFRQFVKQTSDVVICCADGGASELIKAEAGEKLLTYGLESGDLRAVEQPGYGFEVFGHGKPLGIAAISVPGRHNILNALAVIALGQSMGLSFQKIRDGLALFTGTERRFEILGETSSGALVIDDYAHHPTEIRATLAAARGKYPGRRIVALFQPHLPSRTQQLMDDFAMSFGDADNTLITDIYLARELAIPGVTSDELTNRIRARVGKNHAHYVGPLDHATSELADEIRKGDVVLTLGAGSVRSAGESLLEAKS
jgi:UDP-N-acetylmuramate--alanine ligase